MRNLVIHFLVAILFLVIRILRDLFLVLQLGLVEEIVLLVHILPVSFVADLIHLSIGGCILSIVDPWRLRRPLL